eukprot:6189193-Pleurochrysis_carterae.AAC.1
MLVTSCANVRTRELAFGHWRAHPQPRDARRLHPPLHISFLPMLHSLPRPSSLACLFPLSQSNASPSLSPNAMLLSYAHACTSSHILQTA